MALSEKSILYRVEEKNEDLCGHGGSDSETYTDDSDNDPSYSLIEETRGKLSHISINKKSKARMVEEVDSDDADIVMPELDETDCNKFLEVQKIIKAGQLEKLKVEQCKIYLRKHGLRLTGNKATLIQRIKEHLEILNGGGQNKYPVSSFILNCKGDACTGDIVMFEQNVYDMFNIASRSGGGPPCGTRIVAGRIVKESYGAAKQQHTFTIEVLWSKGEKPLPSLYPLLIKGRNLYRLKTLRQKWEDEGERQKVLTEKHSRGFVARSERDVRVQVKEKRKILKANRISRKGSDRQHSQFNPTSSHQLPQPGFSFESEEPLQTQNLVSAPNSEMPDLHQQFVLPANYGRSANDAYHSECHHSNQDSQSERLNMHNHGTQHMFHVNHNRYLAPFNTHLNTNEPKGFPERTIYITPITSMSNFHPLSPPRRQGSRQQLCRYYAHGRCYYGDNCKFSHEMKGEYDQRRPNWC